VTTEVPAMPGEQAGELADAELWTCCTPHRCRSCHTRTRWPKAFCGCLSDPAAGGGRRVDYRRPRGIYSGRFTRLHPEKTTARAGAWNLDVRFDQHTRRVSGTFREKAGV